MLPFIPPDAYLSSVEQKERMLRYERVCSQLKERYEAEKGQFQKKLLLNIYLDAIGADLVFDACGGESNAMLCYLEALYAEHVIVPSTASEVMQLASMMTERYSRSNVVTDEQAEQVYFDGLVRELGKLREAELDGERKVLLTLMYSDASTARSMFAPKSGESIAFQGMLKYLVLPGFPITLQTVDKVHCLFTGVLYKGSKHMPELNKNTLLDLLNEVYMEILDPVVPITLGDLSLRCNEFIPKVRPILVQEGYILDSEKEEKPFTVHWVHTGKFEADYTVQATSQEEAEEYVAEHRLELDPENVVPLSDDYEQFL